MSLYKKSLLIVLILCLFTKHNSFSQENTANKISYTETVSIDFSKADIQSKANTWLQSYYKNASSIIKTNNETNLVANPHFRILNPKSDKGIQTTAGIIQYTISFEFSEGKYEYKLTDFYLKKSTNIPIEKWQDKTLPDYKQKYAYYLEQLDIYAKKTISSLKRTIKE